MLEGRAVLPGALIFQAFFQATSGSNRQQSGQQGKQQGEQPGRKGFRSMEILYEDNDILVVNKESGLPVQAGNASQKDLISVLKNYLHKEDPSGKEPYLGIVHRLDQPVEGLLVFAKNNKAAGNLSRQVQAKADGRSDMRKVYQAMVILKDKASSEKAKKAMHSVVVLQNYLRRNYAKNMTEIVPKGTKGAKWAELTFRTLKIWTRDDPEARADKGAVSEAELAYQDLPEGCYGRALLEVHLHTGRHHQIRAQLSKAGLPLDGDRKYGPAGVYYSYNLRLCAAFLQFRHPVTGKKMQFSVKPSFTEAAGAVLPIVCPVARN